MDWRADREADHATTRRGFRALFAHHSSLILPLLACSGTAAIAALFLHLGSEVTEGETRVFDEYVLHGAKAARSARPWITEVMRDLSGIGGTVTLLLVTIAACGYLALTASRRRAIIVALSIAGAEIAVESFKAIFERARPDAHLAAFAVTGLSFPPVIQACRPSSFSHWAPSSRMGTFVCCSAGTSWASPLPQPRWSASVELPWVCTGPPTYWAVGLSAPHGRRPHCCLWPGLNRRAEHDCEPSTAWICRPWPVIRGEVCHARLAAPELRETHPQARAG